MLKNYLKIAWRHLLRDKATATINIFGLSVAIAISLLIGLYIHHEWNYDNWYETEDELYRVYRHWGDKDKKWVWTPGLLSQTLAAEFPEVQAATYMGPLNEVLLTAGEKKLYVERSVFVDSTFFKTLPFIFKLGDAETALDNPNAIVLSTKMATQFFGTENPIGKTLLLNGEEPRTVTGVVTTGGNTHLNLNVYLRQHFPTFGWLNNSYATYVRLHSNVDMTALAQKVKPVVNPHFESAFKETGYEYSQKDLSDWAFQPIRDIHLKSQNFVWQKEASSGDIRFLYLLGLIASILLLIAIFNYANLSIAQASTRIKEIGVRKVNGALQSQVVRQFLVEAIVQSFLALTVGGLLAYILLPTFQDLLDVTFEFQKNQYLPIAVLMLGGGLFIGLLAGIYPVFYLARLQPQRVFSVNAVGKNKFGLRQILVVAQFVMVITLLIAITFISQQVDYMLSQELGFKGEQVITIPMDQNYSRERIQQITNNAKAISGVVDIGISSHVPGEEAYNYSLQLGNQQEAAASSLIFANEGIINTWDLKIIEGRNFSATRPSDSLNFIVNEAYVKEFGLEDPLHTPIRRFGDSLYYAIIGVVADFHQNSLDNKIEPMVLWGARAWESKASVKINPQNLPATIKQLETLWQTIEPNRPMRYTFLDESFAQQYASQLRFRKGLSYATGLTILIAMLGLFGLASFSIKRRRKEIGIRKVLGASILQVVGRLNKDFLQLILIALVFAIPLGWYIGNEWLQHFPYRIDMQWWVFALTGLAAIGIAAITVSFQSIRAAIMNPVHALRDE